MPFCQIKFEGISKGTTQPKKGLGKLIITSSPHIVGIQIRFHESKNTRKHDNEREKRSIWGPNENQIWWIQSQSDWRIKLNTRIFRSFFSMKHQTSRRKRTHTDSFGFYASRQVAVLNGIMFGKCLTTHRHYIAIVCLSLEHGCLMITPKKKTPNR